MLGGFFGGSGGAFGHVDHGQDVVHLGALVAAVFEGVALVVADLDQAEVDEFGAGAFDAGQAAPGLFGQGVERGPCLALGVGVVGEDEQDEFGEHVAAGVDFLDRVAHEQGAHGSSLRCGSSSSQWMVKRTPCSRMDVQ